MNPRFCLLIVIFVSLLTSCANLGKNKDKSADASEVIFDDGYKTATENEVFIADNDFKGKEAGLIPDKTFEETTKTASDGSRITTVFDRSGNKIEIRIFNSSSRLARVILRTSPAGEKQVFVYGQNGETKPFLGDRMDMVLTASPDEIANTVGIYGTRQMTTFSVQNSQPLKPLPSSDFPIVNSQIANSSIQNSQTAEQPVTPVSQTLPGREEFKSKQTGETTKMNQKPEENPEERQ